LARVVGTSGWYEWLARVVSTSGWYEWLVRVVGTSDWYKWLDRVVGSSGWIEWLDRVVGSSVRHELLTRDFFVRTSGSHEWFPRLFDTSCFTQQQKGPGVAPCQLTHEPTLPSRISKQHGHTSSSAHPRPGHLVTLQWPTHAGRSYLSTSS